MDTKANCTTAILILTGAIITLGILFNHNIKKEVRLVFDTSRIPENWSGCVYTFNADKGTTILKVKYDGSAASATNGTTIFDKESFKLENIDDMKRLSFICVGGVGTVTAAYSFPKLKN